MVFAFILMHLFFIVLKYFYLSNTIRNQDHYPRTKSENGPSTFIFNILDKITIKLAILLVRVVDVAEASALRLIFIPISKSDQIIDTHWLD